MYNLSNGCLRVDGACVLNAIVSTQKRVYNRIKSIWGEATPLFDASTSANEYSEEPLRQNCMTKDAILPPPPPHTHK